MKLFLISVAMRVFSWVSPRTAEYFALLLAALVWYSVPRLRRTTRINLATVYPDLSPEERNKIGRASMTNYARSIFEALLPDQEPTGGSGEFAPFFGIEARTGVLLPRMAQRTGAPVIFAVCE